MRLRAVLAELTSFVVSRGTGKQKRMAFVIKRVANDMLEELADGDPENLSIYFDMMAKVVSWIGTGRDEDLPESMRTLFDARSEGIRETVYLESKPADPELDEEMVAAPSGGNPELSGADTRTG